MRADSFSSNLPCTSGSAIRVVMLLFLAFFLSACKTEKDSADPVILGVPPEDAYLGVEYSYNFGAIDEDDVLDYSLTNTPSWLALEDTTNKARQGIIMRGVPGITGGNRGRDDLGRTSRINLVGTDRATLGAQPFSIDVQENLLSVVSQDYSEARPEVDEEQEEEDEEKPDFQCEQPFVDDTGEHTYSINKYDDSGFFIDTEEKTSVTRPILVQVNLDQPSVTRVNVAFELRSNFDPTRCDRDDQSEGDQGCDTGLANSDEAIIGRDIVGLGSGSGASLPVPEYVDYQQDDDGLFTQGVLTLEAGITECYVRLEVVDDLEPERVEAFTFALTEVRSGIAGLGPSNAGVREPLRIEDNEPTVSLQTRREGKRDVVNLGTENEYTAIIQGERDESYFAKISAQEGSDAIQGTDFTLQLESSPGSGTWTDADLIEFPVGTNEVAFRVKAQDAGSYKNPADNDRFMLLGLDAQYQAGRSNHAASISDDELRININELETVLEVGSENGFVPTDIAIGQNGRVFIAGYDAASGNTPVVRVVDQKGNQVSEKTLYPRGISPEAPPVISASSRDIEIGGEDVLRYEFAVAFGVEEDSEGNPTPDNVNIVTQRWFYDTALAPYDYAQDWQLVSGSEQDDLPRWVGIAPRSGNILVSGVTQGLFETNDTPNGRFGSFVQLIDTQEDGDELVPEVAWTRKVESTSHDERVVGGGIQNTFPIVIGDSSGSVEGESQFGGKDAFFYTAQQVEEEIDVQQVGTGADENLADGFFSAGTVWLVGNSTGDYRVTTEQGVKVLRRTATDSAAGFMLGYTPAGSAAEAYLVNDEGDQSVERLQAAMVFDDDLIAAGSTTGVLTGAPDAQTNTLEDPAIFRRNRQPRFEEDETLIIEPAQQWDQQVAIADPGTGVVEALVNYRDDEITTLIRRDTASGVVWTLNLFSAEGDPVNGP
jgi:hypothetical protein